MDNKERKFLEEAGLLYPTPNCVEYYQVVKAIADEVVQRIFEAMSNPVQVVRCKDCTNYVLGVCFKVEGIYETDPDFFCAWGERAN